MRYYRLTIPYWGSIYWDNVIKFRRFKNRPYIAIVSFKVGDGVIKTKVQEYEIEFR